MDETNKIIFWAHSSGLANRLRALIGYQALAKFKKVPFFLCWKSDPNCDAHFSALFNTDKVNLISESKLETEKKNENGQIYTECCWFHEIWIKNLRNSVPWELFKSQALQFAQLLNPSPNITYQIKDFSQHQNLTNLPGFHIRMTDNLKAYNGWLSHPNFNIEYISRLEGFEIQIEKLLSDKISNTIFLVTDNRQIEKYLKKRFPGRILTYEKKWRKPYKLNFSSLIKKYRIRVKQRTSTIEDALVEMYLLSKCKFITGTYFSSYGEFAAVLGKKPYFEILGDQSKKDDFINELLEKNQ